MTDRQCEARTSKGDRCQRPGVYYLLHERGEYLVCKRHYSHEFQPANGVIPRLLSVLQEAGDEEVKTGDPQTEGRRRYFLLHLVGGSP